MGIEPRASGFMFPVAAQNVLIFTLGMCKSKCVRLPLCIQKRCRGITDVACRGKGKESRTHTAERERTHCGCLDSALFF